MATKNDEEISSISDQSKSFQSNNYDSYSDSNELRSEQDFYSANESTSFIPIDPDQTINADDIERDDYDLEESGDNDVYGYNDDLIDNSSRSRTGPNESQDDYDIILKNEDDDNLEPLDLNNLPETVCLLPFDEDRKIFLVGTSHFSKQSHQDVIRVIRATKPKSVVLELCRNRLCFITMDEDKILQESQSLDMNKILNHIKKNGFVHGMIYSLFLLSSSKVTKDLKMAPGGEFRSAFKEASKIPGCSIILGDRPIDITFRRAIATLSVWQKIKIAYHIWLINKENLKEEELEKYKQKDILKQLVDELAKEFPGLAKTIIEERDSFLAHSLWSNAQVIEPGCNMVGVVGIGHLQGIRNKWNEVHLIDIKELSFVPKRSPSTIFLLIKYTVFGAMAYGFYQIIPNSIKKWSFSMSVLVFDKIQSLIRR
ncbi:TraB domain-containing protein [Sarcoptes scabiei]|uniref:TraB domain-containing protein n=1 Tax=Sarcoptes scabiei TaxID=52283 RepID=A0A834VGE5_SARSC|nr:TraB domain-containing protein [Sarcoptes scabiei]